MPLTQPSPGVPGEGSDQPPKVSRFPASAPQQEHRHRREDPDRSWFGDGGVDVPEILVLNATHNLANFDAIE